MSQQSAEICTLIRSYIANYTITALKQNSQIIRMGPMASKIEVKTCATRQGPTMEQKAHTGSNYNIRN